MRVFVTGATGFVGSAVIQELLEAGHHVLGLARSDASAQALAATGAEIYRGSLDDLDSLQRGAAATDGVIHTAFVHDFSAYAAASEIDQRAIAALGAALVGSERPLIITSGLSGLSQPGQLATEESPRNPSLRRSEEAAAEQVARGVRVSVVRLAASVHDRGDHGLVPSLINLAREKGEAAYIGDGSNRWSAVHRLDAARLYRLALERGTAGAHYHGVGDEGIAMRDIAAVIGQQLQVPVVAKTLAEAAEYFGPLTRFAGAEMAASSALTQQWLGWQPTHKGLLADLEQGDYFPK